jgi:hypothetical protein
MTREVITLQVGHYSNFVGTHWWNIQNASFVYHPSQLVTPKEINNDVLFREGLNLMNEVTYTPRLILFDLKGSLNSLKQFGTLYDVNDHEEGDLLWHSDVTMHKSEAAPKNEFLHDLEMSEAVQVGHEALTDMEIDEREVDVASVSDKPSSLHQDVEPTVVGSNKMYKLDESVNVWSDFLHPHMHPRSLHLINSYQHDSEVETFDIYGLGVETYNDHQTKSSIEDKLHFFTEECDNLQGFNMLADVFSGFGGLASSLAQDIYDDFPNKAVMLYTVTPAMFHNCTVQQRQYQTLNTAIAYQRLLQHTSLLLPLSTSTKLWQATSCGGQPVHFPHVNYRPELAYHTSAILAAVIESLTVPYRAVNNPSHMNHLTTALTPLNRKVVCAQTMLPVALPPVTSLVDMLASVSLPSACRSLTSSCTADILPDAMSTVISGVPHNRLVTFTGQLSTRSTIDDLIAKTVRQSFSSSLNAVCTIQQPCRVTAPFPHIFTPDVGADGFLTSPKLRSCDKGVDSIPMMTFLQSSGSVRGHLKDLLEETRNLDIRRLHRLTECGLEFDEIRELINGLEAQHDCYQTETTDMI